LKTCRVLNTVREKASRPPPRWAPIPGRDRPPQRWTNWTYVGWTTSSSATRASLLESLLRSSWDGSVNGLSIANSPPYGGKAFPGRIGRMRTIGRGPHIRMQDCFSSPGPKVSLVASSNEAPTIEMMIAPGVRNLEDLHPGDQICPKVREAGA
jgi:hypothetical protein